METRKHLLNKIKATIENIAPSAIVLLYGSYARGEQQSNSDIDLLILLDKESISLEDEKEIKYPIYDIEFDTGTIISPMVLSKTDWETKHRTTPFYENIKSEGIFL